MQDIILTTFQLLANAHKYQALFDYYHRNLSLG